MQPVDTPSRLLDAGAPEIIACTVCDALHEVKEIPEGGRLRCTRCGATLLRSPGKALDRILASSFAMVILVLSALFFPFLQISASGLSSATTLLQTAFAFDSGFTAPLAFVLILLIIVLPVTRAVALAYALLPLRLGLRLLPGTKAAFRLAGHLRPWSMAEVFMVGCVVALVKIGGLARVGLGPAFWELALIVMIVALEASTFCEKTIWRMIDQKSRS
ncbi:MAG: paraquat-inducible protein A [Rhodobacteraceae bacterium]|nr:paraquat-inducible protein A [Paracoccaceae bacterium]